MPRANKSFLHGVLRQGRVPKDQASDRVQAIASGCREEFESLVIAAGCRLNEISPHALSVSSVPDSARVACYDGSREPRYSNNGPRLSGRRV